MGGARERAGLDGDVNSSANPARRFRRLPVAVLRQGRAVPVASTRLTRLLGLALLDRGRAPGLLIPGCRAVHTVGMRFPLDLHFLDEYGATVSVRRRVPPGRFAREPRARSVLELPSGAAGAP